MDLHDKRHDEDASDRCDVADEIEAEIVVERSVDRVRRHDQEDGVSVWERTHGHLSSDIAARTRPVLDHKLLT